MKSLLLTLTLLILYTQILSQETFFKGYNTIYNEYGNHITNYIDGSSLIWGKKVELTGDVVPSIMRVDENGNPQWTEFLPVFYNNSCGNPLVIDNDNKIVVLSTISIGTSNYIYIVVMNENGEEIANHIVTEGFGYSIATASDGGFYIVGEYDIDDSQSQIIKTDSEFNVVWDKKVYPSLQSNQLTRATNVIESESSIYVSGQYKSNMPGFDRKSYLLKLNTEGDSIWCQNYFMNVCIDYTQLKITEESNIIMAGYESSNHKKHDNDYGVIMEIDQYGNEVWKTIGYGDFGVHWETLTKHPDGSWIVGGATYPTFSNGLHCGLLCKVSNTGEINWQKEFMYSSNCTIEGVITDLNGYIYCTGTYIPDQESAKFILKLSPDGLLLSQTELSADSDISVYPNPASQECNVNIENVEGNEVTIELINEAGETVYFHTQNTNGQNEVASNLDTKGTNAGMYILKITNGKKVSTGKLIVY